MLELLFGGIISGFLGLIFVDIKELRSQINKIEKEVLIMKFHLPKRKTDVDKNEKSGEDKQVG